MEVFRIAHKKWSEKLLGSGYSGRWNSNGMFVIYTAQNRALACLENLVHRNGFGLDVDFVIMTINIPKQLKIIELKIKDLPENWNLTDEKAHLLCREFGDKWLKSQSSCILMVPSAIIKNEKNVLINPNHVDFKKIKLSLTQPFSFDNRLK
ncbi:MAG: RES family NAD+ phosphorylase [Flavobacterium sp.]|nr:RES family NAD+ phosphorylase [Flavobacterium sp.]